MRPAWHAATGDSGDNDALARAVASGRFAAVEYSFSIYDEHVSMPSSRTPRIAASG